MPRFSPRWALLACGATVTLLMLHVSQWPSERHQEEAEESDPHSQRPCSPNVPCVYSNQVDFRILVLTYKRKESLQKLLDSLQSLELDGATAALDIWIDQSKDGFPDTQTVETAQNFNWTLGQKTVHVQEKHVGIFGQWIDTWRPEPGSSEIALILEDDLSVSRMTWRWIRAAYDEYKDRKDVLGWTLQSQRVNTAIPPARPVVGPEGDTVFFYRRMGSWGFVPHPDVWRDFQDWFHAQRKVKNFHPLIGRGVEFDVWYRNFQKKGTVDSMWTIWFIYYTERVRGGMYCVYSNLNECLGGPNNCLAVHRQVGGLHFSGRGLDNENMLLITWGDQYVDFPKNVAMYDFDGSMKLDRGKQ